MPLDDLPDHNPLDAPYALSGDQVDAFRRDGFIRLKRVFSPETLRHFAEAITRATLAFAPEQLPLEERSTYGKAFLQVPNLWRRDESVRQFVFSKRLAGIAAGLLEVEGVRLYHDQSLYKEAGGGFTPAHCDQGYWPLATDRSITAWVPLQATPDLMGPLGFYAGSQTFEEGRGLHISDESEQRITERMEAQGYPYVCSGFDIGEVSFHQGWTYHGAGPNLTETPRSVMTVIYMDSAMRLREPANRMEAFDRAVWCAGAVVGEVIDTPLNPVLFP
jgi:ectoine hydroxylase-related dioxygenase (phytanoyl-CoA dioxygenase family)